MMQPETEAIEHFKLCSKEKINKWIKRGVALILEPANEY